MARMMRLQLTPTAAAVRQGWRPDEIMFGNRNMAVHLRARNLAWIYLSMVMLSSAPAMAHRNSAINLESHSVGGGVDLAEVEDVNAKWQCEQQSPTVCVYWYMTSTRRKYCRGMLTFLPSQ